jgi:hypothetical protein
MMTDDLALVAQPTNSHLPSPGLIAKVALVDVRTRKFRKGKWDLPD